jgi:hypothetical protein
MVEKMTTIASSHCGWLRCQIILLGLLLLLLGFPANSRAHRLDEYLQATLVTIAPSQIRLQINLTPGVDVADQVLALIDRNHDGRISRDEANTYSALLKHDLLLRLDRHKLALKLTTAKFPEMPELRTGWGIIQMEFSAPLGRLATGTHTLSLDNRHLSHLGVYLFNAAQPTSDSVHITKQKRNDTQSAGEIEFTVGP